MKRGECLQRLSLGQPFAGALSIADADPNCDLLIWRQSKPGRDAGFKPAKVTDQACAEGKGVRAKKNIIDEAAMVEPILRASIPADRTQQPHGRFIETQSTAPQGSIARLACAQIRRPAWRRSVRMGIASGESVHQIGKGVFGKNQNAPRLIIAIARRTASVLQNTLHLRPCWTPCTEIPNGPSASDCVQNMHSLASPLKADNTAPHRVVGIRKHLQYEGPLR